MLLLLLLLVAALIRALAGLPGLFFRGFSRGFAFGLSHFNSFLC